MKLQVMKKKKDQFHAVEQDSFFAPHSIMEKFIELALKCCELVSLDAMKFTANFLNEVFGSFSTTILSIIWLTSNLKFLSLNYFFFCLYFWKEESSLFT